MISGERKKFRIKPRQRIKHLHPRLSNTVKVTGEEPAGQGYCYISFDESLVDLVGRTLPRGVAVFDPAYLQVEYDGLQKKWHVWACYYKDEIRRPLWVTKERPEWLTIPKSSRGRNDKTTHTAGSSSGGDETGSS